MICHMCNGETDFTCEKCGEPVCEYCCVPYTIHNQIEYALCKSCGEGMEERAVLGYWKEQDAREKREKEAEAKRAVHRAAARKRYWLPENVEKRRVKKAEERERRRKQFEKAMDIVSKMFR